MDATMQVRQLLIQARLVLLPGHTVDSGRRLPLQRVVALPQQRGRDMVEQRAEPRPFVPTCYFTHTAQDAQLAGPALGPGRGRLPDVLLGRPPSLHALRRCLLTLVRALRRCRVGGGAPCALATVRRTNCTCGFPACSFHEDADFEGASEGIN